MVGGSKQVLAFILLLLQSLWPRAHYLSSGAFSRTVPPDSTCKQSAGETAILGNATRTRVVERPRSSIARAFRRGHGNAGSPTEP